MPHGKNEYLPLRVHSDFTKGRRGREETHVHPSKRCSPRIKHDRRRNWQNDQNSLATSASSGSTSRGTRAGDQLLPRTVLVDNIVDPARLRRLYHLFENVERASSNTLQLKRAQQRLF